MVTMVSPSERVEGAGVEGGLLHREEDLGVAAELLVGALVAVLVVVGSICCDKRRRATSPVQSELGGQALEGVVGDPRHAGHGAAKAALLLLLRLLVGAVELGVGLVQ